MDDDDFIYAEFIFQAMKKKKRNLASTVAEYTHGLHKNKESKQLLNYDHLFKHLEKIDLLKVTYDSEGRGRPQFLELSEIGEATVSVLARIQQLKFQNYNQLKKNERDEEFIRDQSEYYKRQNWLSKYWYLTATMTTIIGALIQKFFKFF